MKSDDKIIIIIITWTEQATGRRLNRSDLPGKVGFLIIGYDVGATMK